mgnify:CR=1 FL=1
MVVVVDVVAVAAAAAAAAVVVVVVVGVVSKPIECELGGAHHVAVVQHPSVQTREEVGRLTCT